jgi:DNA segregation ATPase FtsK/SpoIIIE-like protein
VHTDRLSGRSAGAAAHGAPEDILEAATGPLEKVVRDFSVKGDFIHVHPGPVVTLCESSVKKAVQAC